MHFTNTLDKFGTSIFYRSVWYLQYEHGKGWKLEKWVARHEGSSLILVYFLFFIVLFPE